MRGQSFIASGRVPKTMRTGFEESSDEFRVLLVAVCDSPLGEVIGRHLQGDSIAS